MRAAGIRALGEPVEILEVDELAPPGADEVLIDVAAAGVGNWDELVRIGSWRIGGPAPMALGTEAAGTIVAAGSVDDDPAAALDSESLVECLGSSERRNGKRSTDFP